MKKIPLFFIVLVCMLAGQLKAADDFLPNPDGLAVNILKVLRTLGFVSVKQSSFPVFPVR